MNTPNSHSTITRGIIALSFLFALNYLFDWVPFLRGGIAWQWPAVSPSWAIIQTILPGLLILAIYLLGFNWLRRGRVLFVLLWACAATVAMTVAWMRLSGDPFYELYDRTVSVLTTGSYSVAARFDTLDVLLRSWPDSLANERFGRLTHMSTSPPGWAVIYRVTTDLFERMPSVAEHVGMNLRPLQCHDAELMSHSNAQIASAWFGILSPLWIGLTVFPLHGIAKAVTADRENGHQLSLMAAAWWPLVPSGVLFVGTHNAIAPLVAACMLFFFVRGLSEYDHHPRAKLFVIVGGILTVVCLFINFVFVPLIMLCGWLALLWHQPVQRRWFQIAWRKPIEIGAWFAVGLALALFVYRGLAGHHLWELLPLTLNVHLGREFAYLPLLWLNSWDVIIWFGLPAALLFLYGMWLFGGQNLGRVALALVLTIGLTSLSGTARGETGRLWLYFMPLMLIPAVAVVGSAEKLRPYLWAAQTFWLVVFVIVMRPVGTGLTRPPSVESVHVPVSAEAAYVPVNARFGDEMELMGVWGLFSAEENALDLWLQWRPLRQMQQSYLFSTLPVAPDGGVVQGQEWLPFDFQYPTTCWSAEQPLTDHITLDLGDNPQSGDWWLSLSGFTLDAASQPTYLPIMQPNGATDPQQIGLGPFSIP
ncbi:MAG: hypothetical protein ACPG8W_24870 [Candidatus Promineifilaceae bacterium]